MNNRLTLAERGDMAIELRKIILLKTDPERLESIEDPDLRAADSVASIYAFEFFLESYRLRFEKNMEEMTDYFNGWSKGGLERNEQLRSDGKVARICAELIMRKLEEDGVLDRGVDILLEENIPPSLFQSDDLNFFLYEVFYELAREYSERRIREM